MEVHWDVMLVHALGVLGFPYASATQRDSMKGLWS